MVSSAIIAFLLGLLGGAIRVAIAREWIWPHKMPADDGRPGIRFGSLGTLVAGGASGCILWALFTRQLLDDQGFGTSTIAATVLVGIGGGEVLMSWLDNLLGVTTSQQAVQQANQETSAIAKSLAESQKTLVQDLSDCQKRERGLREELERLKKSGTPDN
jgi:hypothetical protein